MKKRVFLAEDDTDDQEIFQAVISDLSGPLELTIVDNGESLVQRLSACADAELPHLIVLDQNMPRLNGYDTIRLLRSQPKYREIPMVICSTYHDTNFLANCRREEIELLQKPDTYNGFRSLAQYLVEKYVYRTPDLP